MISLHLLEEYGAKIEYFSPLYDSSLPDRCCGILLGGGYPEIYAKKLSQNKKMLYSIKKNCPGNPIYKQKEGKIIKICTDCTFPHQPENYDMVINLIKGFI